MHVCVPRHTRPQRPQLVRSVLRLVSQPSASRLQLPQPELHVPTMQAPNKQAAVAFETTQRLPQREQLLGSSARRDSQPFDALPSQLL